MILRTGLLLFLAATGWAAPDKNRPPATVLTSPLVAQELSDQLVYPARVIPKINTVVLAETDGIVSQLLTPLGQKVKKHQTLMTITHTDPVYRYAPMRVITPVQGIVSAIDVTEGTQVNRGQRLASVTDPSKVRLTVEVPSLDLPSLKVGQPGEFKVSGGTASLPVLLRGLSPFVDPATGTATAELEVAKPEQASSLAPGQIGQVTFKANARQGLSIPDHAVFYHGNDTLVRVLDGNRSKTLKVSLGKRSRGYVEVLQGLAPGQTLIERTSRYVSDGEAVEAQPTAKPENKATRQ